MKEVPMREGILDHSGLLTFVAVIVASCFIGLSAQIKIPLFFTPVPLTIQTSAVMLCGALLGSRNGALAALCYILQGCCGLPVWSGGNAGFAYLMGPTGGYLLDFIVIAYVVGWFFERGYATNFVKIYAVLFLTTCFHLLVGSLWLSHYVGDSSCFYCGFYPFIIWDSARAAVLALCLVPYARRVRKNEN